MFHKVISAAVFAAMFAAAPAMAELRGPAEQPPAGFKGQQYVDSRGCVFLRAGYGGQVSWVPRISRDRKQICGAPRSGRGAAPVAEAPAPAPVAPPPAKAPAAARTPATAAPAVTAAPKAVAKPPAPVRNATRATTAAAPSAALPAVVCPAAAPTARRFATTDGGSVILCLGPDGRVEGAPVARLATGSATVRAPGGAGSAPAPGYKPAWEDDRLNPHRGKQTAAGIADQDRLWTRDVPATLRPDAAPPAPVARTVQGGGHLVQVGSYGVAGNAEGAARRLRALGLPVAHGTAGRLQVVFAGPFASQAEAAAALRSARQNGFADALLLR